MMKNTRLIALVCLAVLFTLLQLSFVSAAALADYPTFFTQQSSDRPYIVVGQYAPAQDVVTASEVALALQRELLKTNGRPFRDPQLDNELRDVVLNLVVVGAAQDNNVIGRLLGTHDDNPFDLRPGEALVTLLQMGGKYQLIITGYTTRETAKAGDLVAQFSGYRRLFVGKEIRIKNGRVVPNDDQRRYINPGLQLVVPDAIRRVPLDTATIRLPGMGANVRLNQRIPVANVDARDADTNNDVLPSRSPQISATMPLPARERSDSEQAWEDAQHQKSDEQPSQQSGDSYQPIVIVRQSTAGVASTELAVPRTVQQINNDAMMQNTNQPQFVAGAHFYEQPQRRYVV